ncbi:hypothetical protein NSZ01_09350 [Nocardioides szechwanensis]|uniref:Uncharacterized conserved protein n=1 Tax=Nocardioides szechwanensis TaxID=1005944 RepID=A0A1G9URT2_9ACTN|nr:hypothetical protein [Nocardioides szechwanensis]GEP33167.1 hypothetical protein NSZ01_09350 [Nocardioides szechwanensis]SDM62600.1 Uncharacterized conserved protein [Nocardioides szechwanensis]
MRTTLAAIAATLVVGSTLATAAPASADDPRDRNREQSLREGRTSSVVESDNIAHLGAHPTQTGISGCFLKTAPVFVTSGVDSLRVWNVSDPARPRVVGTLANALFENEAMNCGERRTPQGVKRFVLIGVDLVQVAPDDIQHVNAGGNELIVVDVTKPSAPKIVSRAPATTSTHTVACVDDTDCRYAYSAGGRDDFSVFDLRNLRKPVEVDAKPKQPGVQPFFSPTGGHKWNFDAAGIGTHTGWAGASMWDTDRPARPRLITTTGKAGAGESAAYPGWNDFILHNSFHPNAKKFRPMSKPSLANGNILLATEEDYEQTDCALAGSFQTWWIKRLDGTASAIVPLDKVELADLGSYPLPQGGFCSSHWFDYRPGGLVAVGFYGGGTHVLDVRNAKDIKPYAHSVWGASEVWDAMWVPVYKDGRQTGARTNVVYSIDLVRGLDVYAVDVPGDGRGAVPPASRADARSIAQRVAGGVVPLGLVGGAMLTAFAVRRRSRITR